VDLGFQPARVIRAYPSLSNDGRTPQERAQRKAVNAAILASLVERLRAQPWVERASLSVGSPFGYGFGVTLKVPGRDSIPALPGGSHIAAVSPDYFATMATPLRGGRVFTAADRAGSTPVVIVGETMAKTIWPNENPLGKCLELYDPVPPATTLPCTSVVGVVSDVHLGRLREPPSMQYYVPFGQEQQIGGTSVIVRTRGDAAASLGAFRKLVLAMPEMPYTKLEWLQSAIDPEYRPWKLGAAMFGVFGILALVIAAVGLYSVIAYLVADRTRELGVRIALGATGGRIIREVVSSGIVVTAAGIVIGGFVALVAGRFVEPLLFDVKARDPIVLSSVSATVLAIAVFAAWWPARRASKVDPVVALRAE
jgi:predicted permease